MARKPTLNFDVSVSGAKKRGAKRRGLSGGVETSARGCEWEGCDKPGLYRAPKSRDQLDEFRWFCLDHVREYNQRWNYYENMSDAEVTESAARDRLWDRPTWKFGQRDPKHASVGPHTDGEAWRRFGLDDPTSVLGDKATINPGAAANLEVKRVRERLLPKPIRNALEVMQLDAMATKSDIRDRYKELVRRYHPDQNGGDRSEEARLRDVIWAWDQLKKSDAFGE